MNSNDNILQFVKQRMYEIGYAEYEFTLQPWQYTVAASSNTNISEPNVIHFLSNVYMGKSLVLNGSIVADDNADTLNPVFINRNYSLLQLYRGNVLITNSSAGGNLYVEFIKAIIIKSAR